MLIGSVMIDFVALNNSLPEKLSIFVSKTSILDEFEFGEASSFSKKSLYITFESFKIVGVDKDEHVDGVLTSSSYFAFASLIA